MGRSDLTERPFFVLEPRGLSGAGRDRWPARARVLPIHAPAGGKSVADRV